MQLIIMSGWSGAGKSLALNALEDENIHCIDNLPLTMLEHLIDSLTGDAAGATFGDTVAISLDVRNLSKEQPVDRQFEEICETIKKADISLRTVFLDCDNATLATRYTETRHTHPLATETNSLLDALNTERDLLGSIKEYCDLVIDTSGLNPHQCARLVRESLCATQTRTVLVLQSFAFRKGAPLNSNSLFDMRCLPNPYWRDELRALDGRDERIAEFFEQSEQCTEMIRHIYNYLRGCLPCFERASSKYYTASVGCTGGRHRSVYTVERLHTMLSSDGLPMVKHHRELATN